MEEAQVCMSTEQEYKLWAKSAFFLLNTLKM